MARFRMRVITNLMKTIATFSKPEEAHLVRMRLESAGIAAFVQNENMMIKMDNFYSNATGGVWLEVADEDEDAAKEFLTADKGLPDQPNA